MCGVPISVEGAASDRLDGAPSPRARGPSPPSARWPSGSFSSRGSRFQESPPGLCAGSPACLPPDLLPQLRALLTAKVLAHTARASQLVAQVGVSAKFDEAPRVFPASVNLTLNAWAVGARPRSLAGRSERTEGCSVWKMVYRNGNKDAVEAPALVCFKDSPKGTELPWVSLVLGGRVTARVGALG